MNDVCNSGINDYQKLCQRAFFWRGWRRYRGYQYIWLGNSILFFTSYQNQLPSNTIIPEQFCYPKMFKFFVDCAKFLFKPFYIVFLSPRESCLCRILDRKPIYIVIFSPSGCLSTLDRDTTISKRWLYIIMSLILEGE